MEEKVTLLYDDDDEDYEYGIHLQNVIRSYGATQVIKGKWSDKIFTVLWHIIQDWTLKLRRERFMDY